MDEWDLFCVERPDLVRKINTTYAKDRLEIEGNVLSRAKENALLGLKVLKLIDPEYRAKQGEVPNWDFVVQLKASAGSPAALALTLRPNGQYAILYSHRW